VDHLLRATAAAERRHFWFRGFRLFVTPLLQQATRGAPGLRLLDCGCGTGANIEMLAQFGRSYGFDLSATGLTLGRAAGRTKLSQASVAAVPFRSDTFDVVTSFDVLYSLEQPVEQAAAAEMYRVAKPGGFLVVNVAAMEILRGDHSVLSREVRRYSRESLSRLLTDAGFRVIRMTYTNASLFAPMLVARFLQRLRGLSREEHAQQEITVPAAPVNALLSGILTVESLWLRLFDNPVGSSLLCLAQKPDRAATHRP
jgi:SAM-dependent methyltransferase